MKKSVRSSPKHRSRSRPTLDLVSRDALGWLVLCHELEQKGAGLRLLEPEFCTSTDTGRILVTVLGMVAEMERRFILERQRAASMPPKERASTKGESPRCLSRLCARCATTAKGRLRSLRL